jgi:hypothetical protein
MHHLRVAGKKFVYVEMIMSHMACFTVPFIWHREEQVLNNQTAKIVRYKLGPASPLAIIKLEEAMEKN